MKTHAFILIAAAVAAAMGLSSCTNPAVMKINTPAVQAQILGDVEKDLLAGGGALLLSGGSSGAAVAALTAQEAKNIPQLQAALTAQEAKNIPQLQAALLAAQAGTAAPATAQTTPAATAGAKAPAAVTVTP